ncbi:MAG: hypothetical protein R3C53_06115 [Pirellulaceae bacterium]
MSPTTTPTSSAVASGGWDVWVHNAQCGFKSLNLRQQVEYLRDKGVEGADQLLANMSSAARNVRQGARFQAKRAVNYYLAGNLIQSSMQPTEEELTSF